MSEIPSNSTSDDTATTTDGYTDQYQASHPDHSDIPLLATYDSPATNGTVNNVSCSAVGSENAKEKVLPEKTLHNNGETADCRTHQLDDVELKDEIKSKKRCCTTFKDVQPYLVVVVLLLSNLVNYMDRYTIAGVLEDIQLYFSVRDAQLGMLQTSFFLSYMILSPLFGFLGDRFSRKLITVISIAVWSAVTLGSSFITEDKFEVFLLMRLFLGGSQAGFSTVAPTLIADVFTDSRRMTAISVFYLAIPMGSGLGYIVGAYAAKYFGSWQWALRVTPVLGLFCTILTLLLLNDPPRGQSEGATHLKVTSWTADLLYLAKNKSYVWSSLACSCVTFVAGALGLWGPLYIYRSFRIQPSDTDLAQVSMLFGLITCIAGFSGVAIGAVLSAKLRRFGSRVDALICASGVLLSVPFLYCAVVFSRYYAAATWALILLAETLLSLNWALTNDILFSVVIPTRRSIAEAVQIFLIHALGDTGSPYIIGLIADSVVSFYGHLDLVVACTSLQYAIYLLLLVSVAAGGCYLATAIYIPRDKWKMEVMIKVVEASSDQTTLDQKPEPVV